ncbi:unnamed protein product [Rhizoctonia solani]|uniref:Uncharacterized protein n=1 Tax=Rhizoctonia solani TaxID=456999 RepID=A0A8H3E0P3_9AGAM|nr:unnamed protein product [Rhizoctonia solani]
MSSSILPPGLYNLRFVHERDESPSVGGLYATQEPPNVILAPNVPGFIERQAWEILPLIGGKPNSVTIRAANIDGDPENASWHNAGTHDHAPIKLGEPRPFIAEPVREIGPDGIGRYTIRPLEGPDVVGVTLYVGSNEPEDNRVSLRSVPVVPGVDRPVWEIRRV